MNRALPDTELDGFVDALARRIASFDHRCYAAKNLVNHVSLPSADRPPRRPQFLSDALTWPETQRVNALFKRGLQQDGEFEKAWPAVIGTILEET